MAQYDFGTINPGTETGTALATLLGLWRNARDSLNSGGTAPAYVTPGLFWMDTSLATWSVKVWDGLNWIPLFNINPTSHTLTVPVSAGGTGATTASAARTNLGLGALAIRDNVGAAQIIDLSVGTAELAAGAVSLAKMTNVPASAGKYIGYDPTGVVVAKTLAVPSQIVAAFPTGNNASNIAFSPLFLMADSSVRSYGYPLMNGGVASINYRYFPKSVMLDKTAQPISGAITKVFSCAGSHYLLTTTGQVYAMGLNSVGQLGVGDTVDRTMFVPVTVGGGGGKVVTNIFVPSSSIQMGAPASPPNGVMPVSSIAVLFLCSDGSLFACGYNGQGVCGDGTTVNRSTPVRVLGPGSVALTGIVGAAISNGHFGHAFAWDGLGGFWGWGYNAHGQLGIGTTASPKTVGVSIATVSPLQVLAFASDNSGACGNTWVIDTLNDVWSAGWNGFGQCGVGGTSDQTSFAKILTGTCLSMAAGGGDAPSAALVLSDGTLSVMGGNANGQLAMGNGDLTQRNTNVACATIGGGCTKVVFAGDFSITQLTSAYFLINGNLYGAGANQHGQLGQGNTTGGNGKLLQILPPSGFESDPIVDIMAGGRLSTVAIYTLHQSGRVCCCGANNALSGDSGSANMGLGTDIALNGAPDTDFSILLPVIFP